MSRVDTILDEIDRRSASELSEFLQRLSTKDFTSQASDARWAEVGLRLLTESTRDEDWSAYYPEYLRERKD